MNDFIIANLSFIEMAATLFGLVYVVFEVLQKSFMWYLWVLTSITFGIVYYYSSVYAYMGLQIYYIVMGIYGIYSWRRAKAEAKRATAANSPSGKSSISSAASCNGSTAEADSIGSKDILVVRRMSRTTALCSCALSTIAFFLLAYVLERTEDPNPWLDSFCSVISMLATFWLSRQYLHNWYLWIVCNIASTILSISIGQYYAALLYFVMIGMAIWGLLHWKKNGVEA